MNLFREIMERCEIRDADSVLADHRRAFVARGRSRPDALLDRALLAYPEAFGEELAGLLSAARASVLRDGDERSRALLAIDASHLADAEIKRVRRILAGRPSAAERSSPALVAWTDGLTVALAHGVPHAESSLSVRIQIDMHPESVFTGARRVEPTDWVLERWAALGHTARPQCVWQCDPPSWVEGFHHLAIELAPNPRGFREAMLAAHLGAGRVLVPRLDGNADFMQSCAMAATVMPSGWSYLRADRTMGSSLPGFPNGAPHPSIGIGVPDDELFALCASHTWPASLRDSIWLRFREQIRTPR